jgi:Lrp/AsnC family leucine-responsive transcriptional regulator
VRLLEEAGVITGYSADVDPRACGLRVTAFIRVSLLRHERDVVRRFEESIRKIDQVLEAGRFAGARR